MARAPNTALVVLAAVAALAAGCSACAPPPVVRSAATLRAEDLPADAAALRQRADELQRAGDPVSLENAVVVMDRWRAVTPGAYEALWRSARAAFYVADVAEKDRPRRVHFGKVCVDHARAATTVRPDGVEGHFYLAACTGYVALSQTVGAFERVKEIHRAAERAVALDEKFERGGPRRLLGMVYLRAPGWPTSIGDADEGLVQLERAVAIDPKFPPNHLFYAEALLANDKLDEAEREAEVARTGEPPAEAMGVDVWPWQVAEWRSGAAELKQRIAAKRKKD